MIICLTNISLQVHIFHPIIQYLATCTNVLNKIEWKNHSWPLMTFMHTCLEFHQAYAPPPSRWLLMNGLPNWVQVFCWISMQAKKKILSFFLVHYALHILILKHMHILPIHTHVTPLSPLSKGNKTCFHTFHYHQCRGALSPLKHYAFSSTPYSTFRRVSSNSSTRESNINILQSLTK